MAEENPMRGLFQGSAWLSIGAWSPRANGEIDKGDWWAALALCLSHTHFHSRMALTPTSTCFSVPNLQSSIFPALIERQLLFLSPKPKRLHNSHLLRPISIRVHAAAALESSNGSAVVTEKPEETSYGRRFFPLAAVVGQVFLSLSP